MASNVVKELGDEFLNCAVCRCTYTEPKMLPCIHSFCRNCLELCKMAAQQKGDRFSCPICRTYISLPPGGIQALPTNFLLQSLHDKLGEMETKGTARPTPLVQSKRKLTRRISKTRCSTHTNGLSMYCRTCKVFQCMSCTTSDEHKGHDLVDATEAELDVHETLELQAVLLESVQEHARCGETEERAHRALQRVKREAASAEDDITQRAAEAMERIEAEKTAMLSRLRMTEARKLRLINRVLESAAKTKSRCKEIESSVKEAIKSEDDEDVPKTRALLAQLEELRIELENIELEDSLHSLGLEFEPAPEVTTLVGELRDPSSDASESNTPTVESVVQNITLETEVNGEDSSLQTESIEEVSTEVALDTQNINEQTPALTLAESLDAILNETLQPATTSSTVNGGFSCNTDHAWHPPPPPPWHHPPHHHHHHPHHFGPPPHHHHPRHPFGPRWHHGMRHRHPFGGRGRCHHPP